MIELLGILAEAEEDVNTGRVAPIKIIGLGTKR